MKFNVKKFEDGTNGSSRFCDWDEHLIKMNDALRSLPTYEKGTHTWLFGFKKAHICVGFDHNNGELIVDVHCKAYKDPDKPVLNQQEVTCVIDKVMSTISIFDEFGFIIH